MVRTPVGFYGKSKLAEEQVLREVGPTIMDAGRPGLLAILYEFMDDDSTV